MSRRAVGALLLLVLALLATGATPPASARGGHVEAIVKDQDGKPVVDAVVSLTSAGGAAPAARPLFAVMDQVNKEFVPLVLPVMVGTAVSFPNRDNIRHHVYSFSSAKRFELPLYIGTPAAPIVFDTPGVVVLGCNIHDWMVGYVYVSATPYFAKTGADGRVRLGDVPPGAYEARVWHPRLRGEAEKSGKAVTIADGDPGRLDFVVALKPDRRVAPPIAPPPGYERPQG